MFLLKALSDIEFLTSSGNEFQSLRGEQENAPLYSEVRAKGAYKVPFCSCLRFNECVWDIGISNFVM